ncbi:hypothetical protein FACS1894109_11020 [Spirochaetia bacterium]|nr:hypothetical protein FACS1894109_11020 [Spirochaetia bacterium]
MDKKCNGVKPLSDDELRHILGSALDEDGFIPTCLNYKRAMKKAKKATTAEEAYVLSGLYPANNEKE